MNIKMKYLKMNCFGGMIDKKEDVLEFNKLDTWCANGKLLVPKYYLNKKAVRKVASSV